jgi:hypothetical protein
MCVVSQAKEQFTYARELSDYGQAFFISGEGLNHCYPQISFT